MQKNFLYYLVVFIMPLIIVSLVTIILLVSPKTTEAPTPESSTEATS